MTEIKQAVILCGGLGTRLGNITKVVPKPMVDVKGKPFLEHLIIQLKKNGIKEILLLVGYKSEIIKSYFKSGEKFNIKIKYSYMPEESKTGSRLYCAKEKIKNNFILLYCDNYSSLNIHKLNSEFVNSKKNILFSLVKKKTVIVDSMKKQIKFSMKKKKVKKIILLKLDI